MSNYFKFDIGLQATYPSGTDTIIDIFLMNTTPDFTETNSFDMDLVDLTYAQFNVNTYSLAFKYESNQYEYAAIFNDNEVQPLIITADGGSVGPFRYIIFSTDISGYDNLSVPLCAIDYGVSITLLNGQSLKINFNDNKVYKVIQ